MSGPLNVATPARQPISDRQAGFTDGLNTVSDPAALSASQARQMVNYRLSTFGAASRRGGTQAMSAAIPNAAGLVQAGIWWGTDDEFVIQSGKNLYTGGASIPVTWTVVPGSTGNIFTIYPMLKVFVQTANAEVVYIADSDPLGLKKWDGTTFTNGISGTPVVTGLEVYNQRLWGWFGGVLNVLYYSNLSTATLSIGGDSLGVAGSGGGEIIIQTFGQSNIICCKVIGSSLVIFQAKGISRLTGFGQSDITVQPQSISSDFSLVGQNAVTVYAGVGFAVSELGLYAITEANITPVGNPQKPDPLPDALKLCTAYSEVQVAYNAPTQEVWIQVPGVGLYVYQTQLQSWAGPWTGPYENPGVLFLFPGDNNANPLPRLIFGDNAGQVLATDAALALDSIASDGSGGNAFTSVLQMHRMFGGSAVIPGTETSVPVGAGTAKTWRNANVLATLNDTPSGFTPTTLTATTVYGGTVSATLTNQSSTQKVYYTAIGGSGPYVDITISDGDLLGGPMEYASVEVTGFATGIR